MRSESTESTMPPRLHKHHGARIPGHNRLQTGTHDRRLTAQQRHSLTLHVGTHQGSVGIVVLEKRNQGRGNRHQLLRADIHEVDTISLDGGKVTARPGADALVTRFPFSSIDLGVGLGDDVLLLFPGGQVPGMGLAIDRPLLAS